MERAWKEYWKGKKGRAYFGKEVGELGYKWRRRIVYFCFG